MITTPRRTELPPSFIRKREWLLKSLRDSDPSLDYKLFTANDDKFSKSKLTKNGVTIRTSRKLNLSSQNAKKINDMSLNIHSPKRFNTKSSQLKLHLPATPMLLINNVAITDRETDQSHRHSLLRTVRYLDSFQMSKKVVL